MKLPDWLKLVRGDLEKDDDGEVDMLLAEPIGFDPATFSGMSAREFAHTLGGIPKQKTVNLLINTLGGNCNEGIAMHNFIAARGKVNTVVVGYAASMGAIIAQAGTVRRMMPGTMMIIHNPFSTVEGDYREAERGAETLKQLRDSFVDLLASRTKQGKRAVAEMMDDETWMSPQEAKRLGFCDEVIEGSEAWNTIAMPAPAVVAKTFRQFGCLRNEAAADVGKQTQKPKHMKLLIAALAAARLLPSADMSDEGACVSAFNERAKGLSGLETENGELKNRVKAFEDAQKLRATGKVDKAIADKLVKSERRDSLIAMGVRDEAELDAYLGDLAEARGNQTPPPPARRGAPPAPPVDSDNKETNDQKITRLQGELKEASGDRKVQISRELRTLRGHGSLFEAPKA